jgi:hypothetical protein
VLHDEIWIGVFAADDDVSTSGDVSAYCGLMKLPTTFTWLPRMRMTPR